jgi:hypothetical protein
MWTRDEVIKLALDRLLDLFQAYERSDAPPAPEPEPPPKPAPPPPNEGYHQRLLRLAREDIAAGRVISDRAPPVRERSRRTRDC